MTQTQGTLIYIEKENTTEAEFMSRNFVNKEVKNKAYLNVLGAEIVSKYLKSEGFDTTECHNMHSISKILENIDIADILLPNIHIDVRVIFDKKQIFIPKSHFELQILPDIYAVVKFDDEYKQAEFIGYFKPSEIDKQNQNADYYFISEDKLSNPNSITKFIKDYPGKVQQTLSEEDFLRGRELAVSLADHNITDEDTRDLLQLLLMDSSLRESVIEFDNFETLSYGAAPELANFISEMVSVPASIEQTELESETIENLEEVTAVEEEEEEILEETSSNDEELLNDIDISDEELSLEEDIEEVVEEQETNEELALNTDLEIDNTSLFDMKDVDLGDDMLDSDLLADNTESDTNEETIAETANEEFDNQTQAEEISAKTIEEPTLEAPIHIDLEPTSLPQLDLSVDSILDQTIAAIGENIAENVVETAGLTAEAASLIAGTASEITTIGTADIISNDVVDPLTEAQEKEPSTEDENKNSTENETENNNNEINDEINTEASTEAMKLASVSGDAIEDVVTQNIEQQGKRLDRIDYEKTDIAPDVTEIPEHIRALGTLSASKMDANLETEESGEFNSPLDISELDTVETYEEEVFEQETIDIDSMETVETEEFSENTDGIVDLSSIDDIDSPTKPVEDIENLTQDSDIEGIDLPDVSAFTINDDGTSSLDNFDMDLNLDNSTNDENLVDMGLKMNLNEFSLDENDSLNMPEIENINNDEHLNDIPAFNASNIIESIEDSPVQENFETAEILEDTDNNEILDQEFDEISLEDFEDFANQTDENEEISNETEVQDTDENEEFETEEQDWLSDTNYDELQDIEPETTETIMEDEISNEELINEPVANIDNEIEAMSNSTIISDKTLTPGEIPIDINNPEQQSFEGPESLEEIYASEQNIPGEALLQNPGRVSSGKQNSGLGARLGIVGTLIALALVGVIGFSVAKMFKAPTEETPQPITDENIPTSMENETPNANTLDVDPNNVVNMDENTDALASTTPKAPQAKPAAQTTPATTKKMSPTSFIEIKKLTWEVPDYISYNPQFKQYFQSVGKSLKLSLGSDLLLATDPVYSNQVRVSVTFNKDGSFKTSRIIVSSGSTQIDKIVLQTVNQTLTALKAPSSVGNDESTTAILKLYF